MLASPATGKDGTALRGKQLQNAVQTERAGSVAFVPGSSRTAAGVVRTKLDTF
jgi:hypothetical protein